MELNNFIDDLKKLSAKPFEDVHDDLIVTYCTGIAMFPADANNADDIIQKSKVALAEAKKKGYGTVCYYSEQLFQKNIRKISLEQELRAALKIFLAKTLIIYLHGIALYHIAVCYSVFF